MTECRSSGEQPDIAAYRIAIDADLRVPEEKEKEGKEEAQEVTKGHEREPVGGRSAALRPLNLSVAIQPGYLNETSTKNNLELSRTDLSNA